MTVGSAQDTDAADAAWTEWMHANLRHAAAHFGVALGDDEPVMGMRLLTAGAPAIGPDGSALWLRVRSEPSGNIDWPGWTGNVAANAVTGIRKPVVLDVLEWAGPRQPGDPAPCRAELMTFVPGGRVVSMAGDLSGEPLTPGWWAALDEALGVIQATPSDPARRERGDLPAMTRDALGVDIQVRAWESAHGDLHWGNLLVPFGIVDWESWGPRPAGTDLAWLYLESLPWPSLAARMRKRYAPALDSEDGRVAQLILGAHMVNRYGSTADLPERLRRHLRTLGAHVG